MCAKATCWRLSAASKQMERNSNAIHVQQQQQLVSRSVVSGKACRTVKQADAQQQPDFTVLSFYSI